MQKLTRTIFAGAILLASAASMLAGGLWVTLGNPDANSKAHAMNAAVTVKLAGCHEPEKAEITAAAIGEVDGQRRTIALKLIPLDAPGFFAVTRQWPAEGRWVLQFVGREGQVVTSTLVATGPDGVDRSTAKMAMKLPDDREVSAMLATGAKGDVARR